MTTSTHLPLPWRRQRIVFLTRWTAVILSGLHLLFVISPVWADSNLHATPILQALAPTAKQSADGRYSHLIQVMHCPQDQSQYGQYHDYGYWGGGAWCGQTGQAGYWVWNAPDWYIWQHKDRP